jgi:16S rRNA (cytosine967-C5)-methyltransferase
MPHHQAHLPLAGRRVAAEVLNQVDPGRQFVHPVLDRNLGRTEERQRCMDLVLGVVRNRFAIDAVLSQFGQRPVERISRPLTGIIRVAVFEMIYCPLTPLHAIVNEAVEVARDLAGPRQIGFVNAICRKVAGHILERQVPLNRMERTRIVPTDAATGCGFDQPVLADPETQTAGYLSTGFSLPSWLAQDWVDRFGRDVAWQVSLASNRRPGIYLRPNPARTTPADLVSILQQQGLEAVLCPNQMVRLSAGGQIEDLPGYREGAFSVQDPTAAGVVADLQPQPGWRILDLCAAPGGKTVQMAEVTGDQAFIFATDSDASRLDRLSQTIHRMGLGNIRTIQSQLLETREMIAEGFDLVLVDAPCSNTGVMARRPEVRHRLRPEGIARLASTQLGLLEKAAVLVRPGGRVGYSTCSIQQTENEDVSRLFLARRPEFRLESQRLTLPSAGPEDHDGGYLAIAERRK